IIKGGGPLYGDVNISGSKNASLPILAASLLTNKPVILSNIPHLTDIVTMNQLLLAHGIDLKINTCGGVGKNITITAADINNFTADYELVQRMRASVVVLGPLLARFGQAKVSLPGGCAIGARPIDFHLDAFRLMGADIKLEHGYIIATTHGKKLKAADITLKLPSVGATENILSAATLAVGTTTIKNVAKEPEITALARFLQQMGAKIDGVGTSTLIIEGVDSLGGAEYSVPADRIEAVTYAIAAAITGGEITLRQTCFDDIGYILKLLTPVGVEYELLADGGIKCYRASEGLKPISMATGFFPGFPTDLQAQLMALLAVTPGKSVIEEKIFENRMMHVAELNRLGANIELENNTAIINGVHELNGAQVRATDLRASAGLILAGLAAHDVTIISDPHFVDRGYEGIEYKLKRCGANIERIPSGAVVNFSKKTIVA
ncbi:MAG: UDP-N-acetylglucosamine 1-carboxyvinyltransferase, partial [Pseudomonadota bacterium]